LFGVLENVFVIVGVRDFVGVAVPLGSTNPGPETVTVAAESVAVEPVAVRVGVPIESDASISVGGNVQRSGNACCDGVIVGILSVAIWVGGGKGFMKEYGLINMLMKIVASAKPASITIDAIMSQNDSFSIVPLHEIQLNC